MDRINKFLALKPSKNHRIFTHKNKLLTVTKKDIHKLYQYKQNKCLDTINLYEALNTKWSKIEQETPIKKNTRKINLDYMYTKFIERVKKYKKHVEKDINEIVDLWQDTTGLDGTYKIENFICKENAITGNLSDKEFTKEDMNNFIKKLKKRYFTEKPRKKYKIEDLLPKIPIIEKDEIHFEEIGRRFVFNDKINSFFVDRNHVNCAIAIGKNAYIYEIRNKRLIEEFKFNEEINEVILGSEKFIVVLKNYIEIININGNLFENSNVNEIKENFVSWNDAKNKLKSSNDHFEFYGNKINIKHKNRIKNVILNKNEDKLIFITGRNIILHDINIFKTIQPVKLKTEIPLHIKASKNFSKLYISTTNNYYVYDMTNKKLICQIESAITCGHTFSINKNITIIGDKENRLVAIYNDKIIRVMEQNKKIYEIICHPIDNFFCVAFKDEMILFYGKIKEEYECSIVKRFKGRFKNLQFHKTLPWLYAVENNEVVLFT
ncbi:hypothetical protein GVAV_002537 [Gurleya vavrai]